jgi:uncharacterized NAD(P)/FAD-binding protein YdhS
MHTTTQRIANDGRRFSVVAAASRAWRVATAAIAPTQPIPPDPLAAILPSGAQRYLRQPWSTQDLARIDTDERVLVLGIGLAAVNLVVALQHQWHRGLVRLVSREELLPQRLADLRAAGRVEVWTGCIRGAASYGDTFVVDVLPHGRKLHSSERYDWIIDCT